MRYFQTIKQFFYSIWSNPTAIFLLLVNILTNLIAQIWGNNAGSITLSICLSALTATIEYIILLIFRKIGLQKAILIIIIALHIVLGVLDGFLAATFHICMGHDIIRIVAETTPEEINSFCSTYIPISVLLCTALITTITVLLSLAIAHQIKKRVLTAIIYGLLSIIGAVTWIYSSYHYLKYHDGLGVPELQAPSRFVHALGEYKYLHEQIATIITTNQEVKAQLKSNCPPNIVVVIGESFSCFHSSLYGYSKETNPLLSKRMQTGQLIVFDDVITMFDRTESAIRSIFTLNKEGESRTLAPLFPVCFKAAGYHTSMLNNQYFAINNGITIMQSLKLSNLMFDSRNERRFDYDGNMLSEIACDHHPLLYVIHLIGQHFDYQDRYPNNFNYFQPSSYNNLPEYQRPFLANYDNATRYNDYVVDQIISKFEHQDCIIIYFSDHGEELFELGRFSGHATASNSTYPAYQLKVPFMIWVSYLFEKNHPEKVLQIKKAAHTPFITDDISHFLMDVADIQTDHFDPKKSFINSEYDSLKKRIVLYSIDYDKVLKQ